MKCFYHPELDAVALCKICHRGLCTDCFADAEEGVVCKNGCGQDAQAVNAIMAQGKAEYQRVLSRYGTRPLALAGAGLAALLVILWLLGTWLGYLLILVGGGLLGATYYNYARGVPRTYQVDNSILGGAGIAALIVSSWLLNAWIGYILVPGGIGVFVWSYYTYLRRGQSQGPTIIEQEK